MKRLFIILASLLALQVQAQNNDWENPAVLGINKLPYHATLQLPSKEKACKEIVSLDGQWFFHWSRNPEERPADFYKEDYDVSQWGKIAVPGNWQTQGYGTPIYININYPFVKDRPRVTTEPPKDWTAYENRNPVGQYVTFVDVTKEMLSKNLILHFGGVHSAMYLWINGQKVGYSQNSMSPAEFDVTKYMRAGKNKVAVEVYRWSDGSYLEDQDMWRLSGIFRPVQLWVRPLVHISDYQVTAVPNADYSNFTVNAKVSICNTGKKTAKNLLVQLQMDCPELYGVNVNPNHRNITNHRIPKLPAGDTMTVELKYQYDSPPRLWSAEKPWLYPFTLQLLGMKDSKDDEEFAYHFGVKRVVDFHSVGLNQILARFVVAFRFNSLNFSKQSGEKLSQTGVIVNHRVGLAVDDGHFNYLVGLAVLKGPAGNELAVAHMRFFKVFAQFNARELRHKAVADIRVVFGFKRFVVRQKAEFDNLRVGNIVEREKVGAGFFQSRTVVFQRVGVGARQQLPRAVSQTLVQVGVQVARLVAVLARAGPFGVVVAKLVEHSAAKARLMVGVGDVLDGYRL